jgi:hypothetical protein
MGGENLRDFCVEKEEGVGLEEMGFEGAELGEAGEAVGEGFVGEGGGQAGQQVFEDFLGVVGVEEGVDVGF